MKISGYLLQVIVRKNPYPALFSLDTYWHVSLQNISSHWPILHSFCKWRLFQSKAHCLCLVSGLVQLSSQLFIPSASLRWRIFVGNLKYLSISEITWHKWCLHILQETVMYPSCKNQNSVLALILLVICVQYCQ